MNLGPDEEWAGGGYGKYPGLPLREIRLRFEQSANDPSMRSISAVLRMTREQLESRGQLGAQKSYTIVLGAVALVALGVSFAAPEALRSKVYVVAGALGFMTLAFGYSLVSKRHVIRRNVAQEREIRRAAIAALEKIMAGEPKLKPLTREQVDTLVDLAKKEGASEAVSRLLSSV